MAQSIITSRKLRVDDDSAPYGVELVIQGHPPIRIEFNPIDQTLDGRRDYRDINDDVCAEALAHGLIQKVSDAAAKPRNTETGRPATTADKYAAMRAVADRLLQGEWNAAREGGGGGTGLLMEALRRHYRGRRTDAELSAFLAAKTPAQKTKLLNSTALADVVAAIRRERVGDDGDAMLEAELGDAGE